MRIVNRPTFLAMPAGTLFSKYEPTVFYDLTIKGDTWGNDFCVQQVTDAIAADNSDHFDHLLTVAEDTGGSFDLDFYCEGRDGEFDEDQLFAVWERADVEALIKRLQETLK